MDFLGGILRVVNWGLLRSLSTLVGGIGSGKYALLSEGSWVSDKGVSSNLSNSFNLTNSSGLIRSLDVFRCICCFTLRSTARVILRWVVYRWRKPVHTAL